MSQLTKAEIDGIKQIADEHFGGDLKLAAAAHIHGVSIVKRAGGRLMSSMDENAIDQILKQLSPATTSKPKRIRK